MASNAIVIGQVDSIAASRDPVTGGIYTYVTLQTSEIWKGSLELGRLPSNSSAAVSMTRA